MMLLSFDFTQILFIQAVTLALAGVVVVRMNKTTHTIVAADVIGSHAGFLTGVTAQSSSLRKEPDKC